MKPKAAKYILRGLSAFRSARYTTDMKAKIVEHGPKLNNLAVVEYLLKNGADPRKRMTLALKLH
jgi:hypothetical protein